MRLNRKVTRIQLVASLVVIPIAGLMMFFSLRYFLEGEIDEKLLADEFRITNLISTNDPSNHSIQNYEYEIVEDSVEESRVFKNEYLPDPILETDELFRVLTVVKNINDIKYSIVLRQSLVETKDFVYVIAMTIIIFLIISILVFQLIFLNLQKNVWKPFFKSLTLLKDFSLGSSEVPKFDETNIQEFNILNRELNFMTKKMNLDYKMLKEFSENASHETQTPLAIMLLELEEVMQAELPEEISKKVYKIFQAANRLSILNDKLFLLTKIDNQEFRDLRELNVTSLVLNEIKKVDLIIKQKNLMILNRIHGEFNHKLDPFALSILIDNLISNAIKHNIENGYIEIYSLKDSIRISNSFNNKVNLERIFERFYKSDSSENSHGLGLSISQRIGQMSNLSLTADIKENEIFFTLKPLKKL